MSGNDEYPGGSLKLTNWISDSGATCHMTPEVSDFIPGSLEDTDKHIEVADGHHVTAKQKGKVQIKMCDNNGNHFIAMLPNVVLDILVYSTKYFARCTSEQKRKNMVTLPIIMMVSMI